MLVTRITLSEHTDLNPAWAEVRTSTCQSIGTPLSLASGLAQTEDEDDP